MKNTILKIAALSVTVVFASCAAFETAASEATTLDQLPKAVRVQVDNDLKGGNLLQANREFKKGEVTYTVKYHDMNGALREVEYLEDGTLARVAYDKRCEHCKH